MSHVGVPTAPVPDTIWTAWAVAPWLAALVVTTSLLYAMGVARASRRPGGGIPLWRRACFAAGIIVLLIALASPVAPLGMALFTAHMVQHTLLMQVAAPLLVLGTPAVAWLWAVPPAGRPLVNRVRRSAWWRRPIGAVTHPAFAWGLHAAALWLWHLPGPYQLSLTSHAAHGAQHASFFGSAVLFWWVLVRAGKPARTQLALGVLYVFTTALHAGVLGALLTFSWSPWYPGYAETTAAWGLTPLEDQRLGGAVMWIPGGVPYLLAILLLLARLLRSGARPTMTAPAVALPVPIDGAAGHRRA